MNNKKKTKKILAKRHSDESTRHNISTSKKILVKRRDRRHKNPGRWKPGESGNPNGRPRKELCITSIIKDILRETVGKKGTATYADQVARAIVLGSIQLDKTALKELMNRVDGPVQQKMTVEEKVKHVLDFVIAKKPKRRRKDEN